MQFRVKNKTAKEKTNKVLAYVNSQVTRVQMKSPKDYGVTKLINLNCADL